MNIIGRWKQVEINTFKNFERIWQTVDEYLSDPSHADMKKVFEIDYIFSEDGTMYCVMPIPADVPQEEIDELIASGEMELFSDGYLATEKHLWKLEDGKFYFDSGEQGEVFGEKVSPWREIVVNGDKIEIDAIRLARAD